MTDENGKTPVPPPAAPAEAEGVPASDRAMAVIGILLGIVIIAIGIDLWTGGSLSSRIPVRESSDDG